MRYVRSVLAPRPRSREGERGFVLILVFVVVLVLMMLAALGFYLSGEDFTMSALRQRGSQSLGVAEGGAVVGRAALMAYMNVEPNGRATLDPALTAADLNTWYANGNHINQKPSALLAYITVDGVRYSSIPPNASQVTFQVNYALAHTYLKLVYPEGAVDNPLPPPPGTPRGWYSATVKLTPNPTSDPSCSGGPCAIHKLPSPDSYEFFYTYTITSDGRDLLNPSAARRRVIFTKDFSVLVHLDSFAKYLMYSDSDLGPGGEVAWANSFMIYKGPVHTNGSFHFAFFPQYTDQITQTSSTALFWNHGSPVALPVTENVVDGSRVDAPLVPPFDDPQTAQPAHLTLGAPNVPMPHNAFSQEGVSIGRSPADSSPVTVAQITGAIPELHGHGTVPDGIYVPTSDHICLAHDGDHMSGGIYIKGSLGSFTLSRNGPNKAVYTLVQGTTTTTFEIDRAAFGGVGSTKVQSNHWTDCNGNSSPVNLTFHGLPKGWQSSGNHNATMIYVDGNINSIGGTLQKDEQTTVAASGTITITDHIRYQDPPNPNDSGSNPTNILGLFSSDGDVQIGDAAPDDVVIQAVMMAGTADSAALSSVHVQNWGSRHVSGHVHLLGGTIGKYYGIYGVMDGSGNIIQGFAKDFQFDTRFRRGFAPPYFPTTGLFVMEESPAHPIQGVRPDWREGAP